MPTRVRSHAKINLGLGIGAPRPDGFHGLATVYQTLEAHDVVTVTASPAAATRIRIASNNEHVPTDHRNTAWKMVSLVLAEMRVAAEVEIHIEKRLPVQGGLGAGSANAVAALVGLEEELKRQGLGTEGRGTKGLGTKGLGTRDEGLRIKGQDRASGGWASERLEIAAEVGSDVPLFLIGGTALGLDRGQQVSPLPDLAPLWCVLAIPEVRVSTPQAFRDWDALCAQEGLTAEASADKLNKLSQAYLSAFGVSEEAFRQDSSGVLDPRNELRIELRIEDLAGPQETNNGSALVRTGITSWLEHRFENDFERVVFRQHPSLAEIKRILCAPSTPETAGESSPASSCLWAALSGSGSALFGLYAERPDAEAAADRLGRLRQLGNVEARITRTIPRAAYWSGMILE